MRRFAALLFLLLALPLARGAEPSAEIPFAFVDGFILLRAQVAGCAEPLTFLLDSGASTTVLSMPAARRLRLPFGRTETVRGVGADSVAYHLPALPIVAGEVELSHLNLAVDMRNASALCSRPIDGLIGIDFFEGRIVQIDYAASCLRLLPASPSMPEAVVPLKEVNGILCAGLSVNGSQPRWTRLDTGCNDSLHWVVPRSTAPKKRGVSIGFITQQRDLTRASVRLGGLALEGVETSLHGQPLFPGEAGLLGNGILARWRITIDAVQKTLSLERP